MNDIIIPNFEFNGKLLKHQIDIRDKILSELKSNKIYTLLMPPGSGMTVMTISLIQTLKLPSLILFRTNSDISSWIQQCEKFTNAKIFIINGQSDIPKNVDIIMCKDIDYYSIPKEIHGRLKFIIKYNYDNELGISYKLN